jgi:hypothetical protein
VSMLQSLVAISFDHDRLCIIAGTVGKDRVKVRSWHTAQARGVDLKDPAAAGKWLAAELDKAGLARSRLVFCIPRGEVVLKRLRLPRGEPAELAGMVRLQMTRQLTMAVEGTSIDYVPIRGDGATDIEAAAAEPGPEPTTISVLAGALPGDRMGWYRAVARAAGCRIERLGLRAAGVTALISALSQRHTGPVLGIAAGWGAVEFVIVQDGELVFTRAADVGMAGGPEGEQGFVARAAVEAKRTWMSYRVGEGSSEVDAVIVPGEGELAQELAQRCGEALEMPSRLCPLPPMVEMEARLSGADALAAAPLIGLLAETVIGRPTLDFAHPRKAPDVGAARRQRVLAAVLGVIVVVGVGAVLASDRLDSLRAELKGLTNRRDTLKAEYGKYLLEDAQLKHIQEWTGAGFDWIAHATQISETLPDPHQAQLDSISGRLAAEVEQVPRDGRYDPDGWRLRQAGGFAIAGKVKKREIADDLRLRLGKVYEQVETKGADTQTSFAFEARTTRPTPEQAEAARPAPAAAERPERKAAAKGGRK